MFANFVPIILDESEKKVRKMYHKSVSTIPDKLNSRAKKEKMD